MYDDLEKDIEWKKNQIRDYLKVADIIKASKEDRDKRIDLLLDDLNKLLKKRKKQD